jgi:hypothetical protein
MLKQARIEAQALVEIDPNLEQSEHQTLREIVADIWQQAGDVS